MKIKQLLLKLISTSTLAATGVGCSQEFAFKEIQEACTPPNSSARYGKNKGPVITSPAAGTPFNGDMTLSGSCENGYPVVINGSGVNAKVETNCVNESFSAQVSFKSGDGKKEVDVMQATAQGGESIMDRLCFSLDTKPPKVSISGGSGAQSINNTTVRVEGTCESGLNVIIEGPNLLNDVTTACVRGRFSAEITFTGGDGLKDVIARQEDPAGNNGQDDKEYLADMTAPVVTINGPAANTLTSGSITLTGACENGPSVVIQGAVLGGVATAQCVGGAYSVVINLSNGDGVKNISATQTDLAGNSGSSNRNFIKDATAPLVRILTPAANSVSTGSVTVTGTCESGLNVNLSGGLAANVNTNCVNGAFSANVNLSNPDGVKEVIAAQTDAAGNSGNDRRNFIRDAAGPLLTIDQPAANSVWVSGLTLQGQCETGLNVLLTGAGISADVNFACVGGTYSRAITFSNGDGVKNIIARQTDGAGNTTSVNRNFVRDSSAPTLSIQSPVANSYVTNNATISGTCESGFNVVLNGSGVVGSVNAPCLSGNFSGVVTFTAGDGNKVVVATQTDAASNVATDSKTYIKDTTAPAISITQPAANTVAQTGVTLQGTCETGLQVNLSGAGLSGPANTACVAGAFSVAITFSNGDGNKNIVAAQTDAAGNTGSSNRTFIRDAAGPNLTITSPAAGTVAQNGVTLQGACESGLMVNLSGAGLSGPASTACIGAAYSVAITFTNGDGNKEITVSQTDAANNTTTVSRSFVRDNTAPVVAINSPAANTLVGASVTISGSCESGLQVQLSGAGLTSSVNTNCIGGAFSTAVNFTNGDGNKAVTASQTDLAGNVGNDARSFIRDSSIPVVTITQPAANTLAQNGVTLQGTCETGLQVNLSGAGLSGPASTACVAGAFSVAITFSNGDGAKNIVASQTDAMGNTGSDSRIFQRDSTAPTITINSPAANTVAATGLTVAGNCETGISVVLWGPGVQSNVTVACNAGAYSGAILFTAGDGNKEVRASQTDAANNSATATRNFIRDNSGPAIAITAPAANSLVGASANISGSCESGLMVTLNGAGLSGSFSGACNAGLFSILVNFTNGDGNKVVVASQTDAGNNTGSDTRTFLRDGTAPLVAITAPAANSVHRGTLNLQGTCENGLDVVITGALQTSVTTACSANTFSAVITLSAGDGNKNVTATQTDLAGNVGSASRVFINDNTAPNIVITQPAANTVAKNGVTLQGTCETGLTINLSGAGLSGPATTSCAAGAFSVAITFSAGDGNKVINVSQTDAVGNVGSDSRTFIRDTTPPAIFITAPAAGTGAATGLTISGTCESGLIVNISGDVSASSTTACNAGTFSAAITFSANLGVKTITVSQTDAVGNMGSNSRAFTKSNNSGYEVFTSKGPGGKVDILFVDDNSASMDAEQMALGTRFSSFTTALSGLDWQAGIVTTDCTAGSPHNFCGQLFDFAGQAPGTYILKPSLPGYLDSFKNTIQRPETLDCLLSGTCPSGREEGLKSAIEAMNRRNTDNAGFFRNDSDLALVFLTDEDEQSTAPATATTPAQVVSNFKSIWASGKKLSSYSIIVKPGDVTCWNSQRSQLGANANYGTYPDALANLTGGISVSICEPDYSVTLTQIGLDVTKLSKSIDLAQAPIAGTVNVVFTPAHSTTWSVTGNRITFDNPAPAGTQIEIFYEY